MTGLSPNQTLIDSLLEEQRSLTAVERFARWHESHDQPSERSYRRLIPASAPAPGQQYAFEVDLDKCSGCKACVTACHSLNGLDDTETWRSVGLLVSQPSTRNQQPFQQHVTTACHHCADPGCANGCPVLAYDKDPVTGIVRHLDDQCMGCSYCVMKCPYEVPKFSDRLGIVRKCDMCSQRLAVGEAPACVQACPDEAIKITLIERDELVTNVRGNGATPFLPDAPDPRITVPTTRFISAKLPGDLIAADHAAPRLDHAHWPLVIMLVLTQAAVGMLLVASVALLIGQADNLRPLLITAIATLSVGLFASVTHLGQPLKAWRAFLGWRRSWLSREIIAFNLLAGAALGAVAMPQLSILAALIGLLAIVTSAMVYVDTRRPFWSAPFVFGSFLGTALLIGVAVSAVVFILSGYPDISRFLIITAAMAHGAMFIWRWVALSAASKNVTSPIHLNARVIHERLGWVTWSCSAWFAISTIAALLAMINSNVLLPLWAVIVGLSAIGSETVCRFVFFAASAAKRMPGGVKA